MKSQKAYPKVLSTASILILMICAVAFQGNRSALAAVPPAVNPGSGFSGNPLSTDDPTGPVLEGGTSAKKRIYLPLIFSPGSEGSGSTPVPTDQPTPTPTFTPEPTQTAVPSATPTSTPTPTSVPSATPTATATPTPTATSTSAPPPSGLALYLSVNDNVSAIGSVANVGNEDILHFDGIDFSLFFDGSDVGLSPTKLNTLYILNADTILMSVNTDLTIPGVGAVQTWDILQFDATRLGNNTNGTFSMYFDGEDVGLDTQSETIDGFHLLEDGRLLISTKGITSGAGLPTASDRDILSFIPASLGDTTSGNWDFYFHGADVGIGMSNGVGIDGIAVRQDGTLYLSTLTNFSISGVSGEANDIFILTPVINGNSTTYTISSELYFDASVYALPSMLQGFDIH